MSRLLEHAEITDDCCSCDRCARDREWNAAIGAMVAEFEALCAGVEYPEDGPTLYDLREIAGKLKR